MKLEISATQVSFGAQGDDVVRVHQAMQVLGRSVPVSEAKTRVLGPGTAAVVKAFQQELNLPVTGIVDAATVRAINGLLDKLASDPRLVRGSVRDANRHPFSDGFVQVFGQGFGLANQFPTRRLHGLAGGRLTRCEVGIRPWASSDCLASSKRVVSSW